MAKNLLTTFLEAVDSLDGPLAESAKPAHIVGGPFARGNRSVQGGAKAEHNAAQAEYDCSAALVNHRGP
jgi:hypothetical protein